MSSHGRRRLLQGGLALAGMGLISGCNIAPPWQYAKVHRIGRLSAGPSTPSGEALWAAFLMGLRDLGYVESQNLIVDRRNGDGSDDNQLMGVIAELVRLDPELILVTSSVDAQHVRDATSRIPIVSAGAGNLVTQGVAASYAHPGGNVTGLSTPPELSGRQLQLFKEAVPALTHVAVLVDLTTTNLTREIIVPAASSLGLQLTWVGLSTAADVEPAFATMAREQVDGLFVSGGRNLAATQSRIAELALAQSLPSMWGVLIEAAGLGGLMAYGANRADLYRRAATFADKILRGAKPADLPVEQPTKFDLVINLKTAQALGLTIPQSVLQQVTEVIE